MSIFGTLSLVIFIVYLVLFCSFLYYYNAQKGTGLSIQIVMSLFVIKVAAGCLNLYIHYREYVSNDVYFYYDQSINELEGFSNNPGKFLYNWLFNWGDLSHHLNLFDAHDMRYLSDLGPLIHSKYMTLANIFTFGGLYTNIIFYNIIFFIGLLQLYKLFYNLKPEYKWLFVAAIFFTPSVLFWCSGIHKDGWVLMAIGILLYSGYQFIQTKHFKYLAGFLFAAILLFVTRYFVFLCLVPSFGLWFVFRNYRYGILWFALSYIIVFVLFFTLGKFTSIEPMEIIIAKQSEFFKLHGYSDMETPELHSTFSSFIQNIPSALNHIFIRPYFSFASPLKYQLAAVESWTVSGIMLISLMFLRYKSRHFFFVLMMLTFAFSMYLFIGYTTPNCGALIRYKSEFTALMLPSLIAISEIPFFRRFYSKAE